MSGTTVLYIPPHRHGIIIGKKGSTINELQTEYEVSISVPGTDPNTIAISGHKDNRSLVRHVIEKLIGMSVSSSPLVSVTIPLAPNQIGLVIGKKGSQLAHIKKYGKTWVDIPKDSNLLVIEGVERYVQRTIKLVEETIGHSLQIDVVHHVASVDIQPINLDGDINDCLFFSGFPECEESNNQSFSKFLRYLHTCSETLDICVFTITDDEISREIIDRHRSGVVVRVITDDDQAESLGSDISSFREAGIEVRTDHEKSHMHHKYAILDGKCVINGSFNWTRQARQDNYENTVVSNQATMVESFRTNFEFLWDRFAE
eukprot:TRINITY_DN7908_c0_g1_i2.p1 TRINITY_DN7908_c0_g1~~TRINITY_DN7908_c0_g1_i2.p1  ORF type:complete len:316 (-),score=66.29 TRINITY_DN7908_c0_g1_i2:67-1014(-)